MAHEPPDVADAPLTLEGRRGSTKTAYLFIDKGDNVYGERSGALGKRFGQLKTKLGYGPELVFHSIRKTFATILQDAGCPEPICADILGHEITSMSYGVYSTGSSVATRREWMERAVVFEGMD